MMMLQNEDYSLNIKFHVIHFSCQNLKGGFLNSTSSQLHLFYLHPHSPSGLILSSLHVSIFRRPTCLNYWSHTLEKLWQPFKKVWYECASLCLVVCPKDILTAILMSETRDNFPSCQNFSCDLGFFFMIPYFESNSPSWQKYRKETVKCFREKNPLIWIGHMHFKSSWHVKHRAYLKELWAGQKYSLSAAWKILPGC